MFLYLNDRLVKINFVLLRKFRFYISILAYAQETIPAPQAIAT